MPVPGAMAWVWAIAFRSVCGGDIPVVFAKPTHRQSSRLMKSSACLLRPFLLWSAAVWLTGCDNQNQGVMKQLSEATTTLEKLSKDVKKQEELIQELQGKVAAAAAPAPSVAVLRESLDSLVAERSAELTKLLEEKGAGVAVTGEPKVTGPGQYAAEVLLTLSAKDGRTLPVPVLFTAGADGAWQGPPAAEILARVAARASAAPAVGPATAPAASPPAATPTARTSNPGPGPGGGRIINSVDLTPKPLPAATIGEVAAPPAAPAPPPSEPARSNPGAGRIRNSVDLRPKQP